jgi:hypothetical protein
VPSSGPPDRTSRSSRRRVIGLTAPPRAAHHAPHHLNKALGWRAPNRMKPRGPTVYRDSSCSRGSRRWRAVAGVRREALRVRIAGSGSASSPDLAMSRNTDDPTQGAAMHVGWTPAHWCVPGWFGSALRRLQDVALDRAQTQPHEVGIGAIKEGLGEQETPQRPQGSGEAIPA